ncbi:MAG: hypothetical protein KAJ19_29740, partial [Gammaproteobacteria bacterium]|nr:hypothetical protein [Gammaproteobacteria bacterium]
GVARVAAISGTTLQQGITSVPSGFPNDTFSSRLSTGERVVTQAQNEDLTQFLASSRNSGDTLRAILGVLISQNQQVNVNIGGEQIIDAIQDQVDEGRQLNL